MRRKARPRRPRHSPGAMNKGERKYSEYLDILKERGEIDGYRFEELTFVLAHGVEGGAKGCRYTPDFMILKEEYITLVDVKACVRKTGKPRFEQDARVKAKWAAERFPEFRWIWAWEVSDGVWKEEEFGEQ